MSAPAMPWAGNLAVPGGRLRYEHLGSGEAVVLLHGFSFDLSSWDPQFLPLASGHHVVRYDLRGFGDSTAPAGERSHIDDLIDLIDALELDRAHLVGLSLGANVALATAAAHPERVRTIVLASPGLPGHTWTTPRPPDEAAARARAEGVAAAKRFWIEHPIFDSTRRDPRVRDRLEQMVARFPAAPWLPGTPERPLPPLSGVLGEISTPALVLGGALDVPGYREIAGILAERLADARRIEFAGSGHLLNLEEPERFTEAVLAFLCDHHGTEPHDRTSSLPPPAGARRRLR